MTIQPSSVDATFYAQVEPEWYRWSNSTDAEPRLTGAKVVTITQQRPKKPKAGTVMVKLTLRLPANAFLPLRPEAIVVVPEALTETTVQVIATDPSAGDS